MKCDNCGKGGEDFVNVDGDDSVEGEERYACSDECLEDIVGAF